MGFGNCMKLPDNKQTKYKNAPQYGKVKKAEYFFFCILASILYIFLCVLIDLCSWPFLFEHFFFFFFFFLLFLFEHFFFLSTKTELKTVQYLRAEIFAFIKKGMCWIESKA